jgi:ABC-type lipoprotein release transport system permease subunit
MVRLAQKAGWAISWIAMMEVKMMLYLKLAWRNMWRHRRRTLIVVLAMGMTLALMMWYDAFVAGFENAIYGNAVKVLGGNIQVHAPGYNAAEDQTPLLPIANEQSILDAARANPLVAEASRRIQTGGMATSREGAFPITIVGIEPELEKTVNLVGQKVSAGRLITASDQDVVFIGQGLANVMGVSVGDRLALAGLGTHNQMRSRTMTVAGIYDVGMPELEKRTVYISLAEAQSLYNLDGQSTEIVVNLHLLGGEAGVMRDIRAAAPGVDVQSWQTSFPEMQAALATKGGAMNIFSIIIMFIVGIGILNLLTMAVFERTREIGLLGALGMKPRQISLLFLLEGAMMGVVGVVFGILLGLAINYTLSQVGFDFSQFATLTEYTALISSRVYPTLGLEKLFMRSMVVLVIAVLAAYFPAQEAARHEPAIALHTV